MDDPAQRFGIPQFLDQLIKTLQVEQTSEPCAAAKFPAQRTASQRCQRSRAPRRTMAANCYCGDFQWIKSCTIMATCARQSRVWRSSKVHPSKPTSFKTLNRCLDNGIADACKGICPQRDVLIEDRSAHVLNERLGALAHELRNHVQTANLAIFAMKTGSVGTNRRNRRLCWTAV
jgi:hypothetical protein